MNITSYTKLQILVFAIVASAFTNIYITQPVLPILQKEFSVDIVLVSFSVSAVILGIALSNLFFGFLIDLFPIHPIILTGGFFVSLCSVVCFFTKNFNVLIIARFIQGIFIPALTTCVAAYLARTLPLEKLNVVMGSYVSATVLGGLSSRLLGGFIHIHLNWRYAFLFASIITIIVIFLAFIKLPKEIPLSTKKTVIRASFISLIKRWELLRIYLCAMAGFGIFSSIFNYLPYRLESPPFNLSTEITTLLYLAYIIGIFIGPIAGKLSNLIGNENTLIIGSIALGIALMLLAYNSILAVIFGLIATCGGFFTIHASAVGCLNRKLSNSHGRANSIYVLFYYLGGWIGITISGYVLKHFNWLSLIFFLLTLLAIPISSGIFERKKNKRVCR